MYSVVRKRCQEQQWEFSRAAFILHSLVYIYEKGARPSFQINTLLTTPAIWMPDLVFQREFRSLFIHRPIRKHQQNGFSSFGALSLSNPFYTCIWGNEISPVLGQ